MMKPEEDRQDVRMRYVPRINEKGELAMQYPVIDKKRTAERINFFMRYNRIKPTDIQKYLGLTCVQTVYRWLDGTNIPSIDNLYALSQLFGVKVDDILAGNRKSGSSYIPYNKYFHLRMYYDRMEKLA